MQDFSHQQSRHFRLRIFGDSKLPILSPHGWSSVSPPQVPVPAPTTNMWTSVNLIDLHKGHYSTNPNNALLRVNQYKLPSICIVWYPQYVFFLNDPCCMFHEPIGNSRRLSTKVFCLDRISLVFTAVDFPWDGNKEPVEFLSLKHMDVPFVLFFPILTCASQANFKKTRGPRFYEIEWIFEYRFYNVLYLFSVKIDGTGTDTKM